MNIRQDVVIVGAGPAGCMASLMLSKHKISHIIIDKEEFPREKICGDGQTTACFTFLEQVLPNFYNELIDNKEFVHQVDGVSSVFEDGKRITLDVLHPVRKEKMIVCKREFIDNEIFKKIKTPYSGVLTGTRLSKVERVGEKIKLQISTQQQSKIIESKVIIAADGERSIVAKALGKLKRDENKYAYSLRCYYENVVPFRDNKYFELFEAKQIKGCGYFWIFPMTNNTYNVGYGVDASLTLVKEKDLRALFYEILETSPSIKERFREARQVSKLVGWGIPFGCEKQKLFGDGFILTGDAAQLANPITGEGFSQALCSGKYAALTVIEAIKKNDFSAKTLSGYQKIIVKKIINESKQYEKVANIILNTSLGKKITQKVAQSEKLQQEFSQRLPPTKANWHLLAWSILKSCI